MISIYENQFNGMTIDIIKSFDSKPKQSINYHANESINQF